MTQTGNKHSPGMRFLKKMYLFWCDKPIFLWSMKCFAKMRRRLVGKHVKGLLYETDNGLLIAGINDVVIGLHLGFLGNFNPGALSLLLEGMGKDSSVLLIGTHVGSLLIPIAREVGRLVGFEANPETYTLLQANVRLNNVSHVEIHNLAVGDHTGEIEFYANKINAGGSKIRPGKDAYAYHYDDPNVIRVPVVALDEFLAGQSFDLIIMDIEGSEYFALKGMQALLAASRRLQVEYIYHHLQNVSQVSNRQFLDLIEPHFNHMQIVQDPQRVYHRSDEGGFEKILNEMADQKRCADLLFTQ